MKNLVIRVGFSLALLMGFAALFAGCESEMNDIQASTIDMRGPSDYNPASVCKCINNYYPVEALSAEETDAILFMREEEKLARDFYETMYAKWEARVFYNISKSEQRHMDAMLCLINKYNLADPVGSNPVGVFDNPTLQHLYDELKAQGDQSYEMALKAGANIEDVDIFDLLKAVPQMDNEDILAVFKELTKGSRNHLRAIVANLNVIGAGYTPRFISQELFDKILNTPKEKGSELCGNDLNGQGLGFNCIVTGQGGNGNCNPANCNGTGQGGNGNPANCNGTGQGGNGNGNGNGNGHGNGGN